MADDYPQVQLGRRMVTLEPFNGRKAVVAGKLVRALAKAWPKIQEERAEWAREYGEQNAFVLTRDQALIMGDWRERTKHMTPEDWDALGGKVTLPTDPSPEEEQLVLFGLAFDAVEGEVTKLVGLAVAPNDEVVAAHQKGDVYAFLMKEGDQAIDEASVGQLVEVLATVAEHVQDELAARKDPFNRLRKVLRLAPPPEAEEESELTTEPEPTTEPKPSDEPSDEAVPATSTEPTSTSATSEPLVPTEQADVSPTGNSSTSLTDSPTPTDGDPEPHLTAPSATATSLA